MIPACNMATITEIDAARAHNQVLVAHHLGKMLETIGEMEQKLDRPSGEPYVIFPVDSVETIQISPGRVQLSCRDASSEVLKEIENQLEINGRLRCFCQRLYNRAFISRVWHFVNHLHWPDDREYRHV